MVGLSNLIKINYAIGKLSLNPLSLVVLIRLKCTKGVIKIIISKYRWCDIFQH